MSFGAGNFPVTFHPPTIRAWHPVESELRVKCPACGCECYPRVSGELLHGPGRRPHPKEKGRYEAPPHAGYCPGKSSHLR